MLLIVAHHYVVNSGLSEKMYDDSFNMKLTYLYLWGMWGKTGINCFVFITGYYMCKSNITLRKILKLLLWIIFYRVVIYIIFVCTGHQDFSIFSLLQLLLPIHNISDGFTGCYLVFFLFIPFLNILIHNLSKKEHFTLLLLCLFIYTIWDNLTFYHVKMNYVIWFSIIYIVASYVRIHKVEEIMSNRKWGQLTLLSLLISIASVVILIGLGHRKISVVYHFVSDSNAIMAVVVSICSFVFFKGLSLKHYSLINALGAATFGVFLIHTNSGTMRQWLWKDFLDNVGHYSGNIYLHSVFCVLGVFIVCAIIDILRLHLIEKPLFGLLDKYMAGRNNQFFLRWI